MRLQLALSIVVLGACIACGGGGGGPVADDGSAPTIVSSSPAAGSDRVEVGAPIRVVFSKPIRSSYQLTFTIGTTATAVTSHLSDDGTTVTVDRPALPALTSASLPVSLQLSNVEDYLDRPLANQPVTLQWAYPDWLPVGGQRTTTGNALLAVQAGAGPVVAWLDGGAIHVHRYDGTSWDVLADPATTGASGLALVASPVGEPVVAYYASGRRSVKGYSPASGWADVGSGLPASGEAATALAYENGVLQLAFGTAPYDTTTTTCVRVCTNGQCCEESTTTQHVAGTLWRYALDGNAWRQRGSAQSTSTAALAGLAGAGDSVLVANGGTVFRNLDADSSWSSLGSPGSNLTAVVAVAGTPLALVGGVVKSYGSSGWSSLGTTTGVVSLDTHGPKPVVASRVVSGTNATAMVLEWNAAATAWTPLGSSIVGPAASSAGIVVAADHDGNVYRCANGLVSRFNR